MRRPTAIRTINHKGWYIQEWPYGRFTVLCRRGTFRSADEARADIDKKESK